MTLEERQENQSFFSDYHKDAYGFRPRHIDTSSWTQQDFNNEFDKLEVIVKENIAEEKKREEADISSFKVLIEKTISLGAGDRETALRWILDGSDFDYNIDYFMWQHGFSIYSEYGKEILPELQKAAEQLYSKQAA